MTDKITLPKETEERIKRDTKISQSNYVTGSETLGLPHHPHAKDQRGHGYYEGATAEATRALPLLEALERIAELSTSRQDQTGSIWGVAHNAINNYNKPVE